MTEENALSNSELVLELKVGLFLKALEEQFGVMELQPLPNGKLRKAVKRIRKTGMTVTGWARVNGFKPDTVFHFLYGVWGNKAGGPKSNEIKKRLIEQGFLKEGNNRQTR